MRPRRIFFLASGRLTVYHFRRGRLLEPLVFTADNDGLAEFSIYLDREPEVPSSVIVDFVEEEFREESVPHVFGSDRKALIRNKKNRLFRDPRYSQAIFQGRERSGRRDDRVLFTALIRPDLLAPWLAQIARHRVPLTGIYSLPVLSQRLLGKLPAGVGSHALLVTLHSSGGLRQSFFRDQQLKVSRLAVMPVLEPGRVASYILGEVERVRRYLTSLRQLTRDTPLDVYVIAHGPLREDLRRQAADSMGLRHHILDVAEVGARVGIRGRLESSYSDLLFARMLAAAPPAQHYASPEETRYASLYRLRTAMNAVSLLLLLTGLVWGAFKFTDGFMAAQEGMALNQQIGFYAERYQIARDRLPPAPMETREIETAVDTAHELERYRTSPLSVMTLLSDAIEPYPTVQLEGLRWRVSADPQAPVDENRIGRLRARAPQAGVATAGGALYHIVEVRGRIEPFDGDYRHAMDVVADFADTLSQHDGVHEVQVTSLPLNVDSDERVEGRAGVGSGVGEASFTIRVVTEVQPGEAV